MHSTVASDARVTGEEGIAANDVDQSIANICALVNESMTHTDRQTIEFIIRKHC
jgi:L-cysteine desulfidase